MIVKVGQTRENSSRGTTEKILGIEGLKGAQAEVGGIAKAEEAEEEEEVWVEMVRAHFGARANFSPEVHLMDFRGIGRMALPEDNLVACKGTNQEGLQEVTREVTRQVTQEATQEVHLEGIRGVIREVHPVVTRGVILWAVQEDNQGDSLEGIQGDRLEGTQGDLLEEIQGDRPEDVQEEGDDDL